MTVFETETNLAPAEVIERARDFFLNERSSYAAFPVEVGANFLRLALEVGEVSIGIVPRENGSLVRGSSSRGAHILTRFLSTINPAGEVQRETNRRP
jgi:hypothetical protein